MWLSMHVSDWFTFLVSEVGILLALFYLWRAYSFSDQGNDTDLENKVAKWIKAEEKNYIKHDKLTVVLKDYQISIAEVHRRDNITLLIGSILTTSSLLILANSISERVAQPMSIYALVSIGLYSLWLFVIHDTAKRLGKITYNRIKAIEKALSDKEISNYNFGIHSYIIKKTRKCCEERPVLWLRIRRTFWGIILFLLSLAWLLLSLEY